MSDAVVWLIESAIHDARGPYYLIVENLAGHYFKWKPDNVKAIRFSRKEDADCVIQALRELCPFLFPNIVPMPRAVEHSWSDGEELASETSPRDFDEDKEKP